MFGGIYQGKRVLVTGHTGFKGGWLSLWLRELGAEVSGFSLPPSGNSLFEILAPSVFTHSILADLREDGAIGQAVERVQPDIIFHLAAQPIVGASYRDPVGTFTTNALGTALLLEAVRQQKCPAAVVVVTSDKCYRNDNSGRPFREGDPLGGHDPYSMSKAAAELVTASWHASFFATNPALGPVATARAGNVIGGGDYAAERIIPDAIRAREAGQPLILRNPTATRPWQHVLESSSGYLALGQHLLQRVEPLPFISLNFGPDTGCSRTVQEVVDRLLVTWPGAFNVAAAPQAAYHEAARLSLDTSRAMEVLGWRPVWDFDRSVAETAHWYRERHESHLVDSGLLTLTRQQVEAYTQDSRRMGIPWSLH